MVSLNFKQELASLRSGLDQLDIIIKETKSRAKMNKALKTREIQIERIAWFAKGYHLKEEEIKSQEKLKL